MRVIVLMSELKTAIGAAEGWLQDDKDQELGKPPTAAQTQFQETLSTARKDLQQLQHSLQERGRSAAHRPAPMCRKIRGSRSASVPR
jgi:ElaB/YqjD/DUF883 family membrane-anchored ribosome-binding protein